MEEIMTQLGVCLGVCLIMAPPPQGQDSKRACTLGMSSSALSPRVCLADGNRLTLFMACIMAPGLSASACRCASSLP